MIREVLSRLAQRRALDEVDEATGRAVVADGERFIRIDLAPQLLVDYAATFDQTSFPDFDMLTADELIAARARRITGLIEECIESDLDGALEEVVLTRHPTGEPYLAESFGRPTRPGLPHDGRAGTWHSDPPASAS